VNINLPPDQRTFIENLVQSGRFASTDEVISECVGLLVSREQLREQVEFGIRQADQGDVIDHDTVFANLRSRATELQESGSQQ
jgi:putative addiction module CopG family antidote